MALGPWQYLAIDVGNHSIQLCLFVPVIVPFVKVSDKKLGVVLVVVLLIPMFKQARFILTFSCVLCHSNGFAHKHISIARMHL